MTSASNKFHYVNKKFANIARTVVLCETAFLTYECQHKHDGDVSVLRGGMSKIREQARAEWGGTESKATCPS